MSDTVTHTQRSPSKPQPVAFSLEELTRDGVALLVGLGEAAPGGMDYFRRFYGTVGLAREFSEAGPAENAQSLFLSVVALPALRSLAQAGRFKEARQLVAALVLLPIQGQEIGQSAAGATTLKEMAGELESYEAVS